MEAIIVFLICAIGFCLYLLNNSQNEILQLKEKIYERDLQIVKLQMLLRNKDIDVHKNLSTELQTEVSSSAVKVKTFVKVIFSKDSKKSYDYFLGKHKDVQIGDFVEVYANKLDNGKPRCAIAEVVYISSPGETSEHAKSSIKRKSDRKNW